MGEIVSPVDSPVTCLGFHSQGQLCPPAELPDRG